MGTHSALTSSRRQNSLPLSAVFDKQYALLLCLLFTARMLSAQLCAGNANTGCAKSGSACRPVTTGTGSVGKCTVVGHVKGELTCECAGTPAPPPQRFDVITFPTSPTGIDASIRIDRPNPQQPSIEYPQITFQPGDTVTIHAGGCVQSGGHGSTWHQYVNPTQNDSLYYGLITIPFATEPLARIQKYWNQSVHIADTAPPDRLHLQLGFLDQAGAYGDNSYDSHDDGPGNQCAGPEGGPAWVRLDVLHHGPGPATPSDPWDLVIAQYDDNGIPLNPNWAGTTNSTPKQFPDASTCRWPWQGGSAKNCASTGQITNTDFDANAGYSFWNPIKKLECASCSICQSFSAHFGYAGHANWMAATQTGTIFWEEKTGSILGDSYLLDDEYSVNVDTPNALGADAGRPDGIHVEFDASETIDILTDDMKIPWWQQFRSAVDGGDDQAHSLLDGKDVIVTGLMGLDFAHASTGPESHPAWAMAVHSNIDFSDDTWAFYVHSSGDEGYCSEQQHYISYLDNEYVFRFPWPKGASSPQVTRQLVLTNGGTATRAQVSFIPNEAVLLTILNVPDQTVDHGMVGGELHVAWSGTPLITGVLARKSIPIHTPPEAVEDVIRSAAEKMNPAQRAIYSANAPRFSRVPRPVLNVTLQTVPAPISKRVENRHPTIGSTRDQALVTRRNASINAITKAYGGTFPAQQ